MKIFLATAILLSVAATGVFSQACHLREVDLCTAMGMFHYQSNGVPSDDEKVEEWCETMKEVEDCMGNFTAKCTSPLQREVMQLLSGGDETGRDFCTRGSEVRSRYLEHAECLAEGAESDEFKENIKDLQVVVERLFDVPFKSRFTLTCCGFQRFYKVMDELTRRRCGDGAVEMVRYIMSSITTSLPETICGNFEPESDQCQDVLPEPGTQPKGGENRSNLGKLFETMFPN